MLCIFSIISGLFMLTNTSLDFLNILAIVQVTAHRTLVVTYAVTRLHVLNVPVRPHLELVSLACVHPTASSKFAFTIAITTENRWEAFQNEEAQGHQNFFGKFPKIQAFW